MPLLHAHTHKSDLQPTLVHSHDVKQVLTCVFWVCVFICCFVVLCNNKVQPVNKHKVNRQDWHASFIVIKGPVNKHKGSWWGRF